MLNQWQKQYITKTMKQAKAKTRVAPRFSALSSYLKNLNKAFFKKNNLKRFKSGHWACYPEVIGQLQSLGA